MNHSRGLKTVHTILDGKEDLDIDGRVAVLGRSPREAEDLGYIELARNTGFL
jgi:hypothetical protein